MLVMSLAAAPAQADNTTRTHITVFERQAMSANASLVHKMFVDLSASDYYNAWQALQQIEQQQGTQDLAGQQPLVDLGRALLLSRPVGSDSRISAERDTWLAANIVRNVMVRGEGIDEANVFLGDEDISLSVDLIANIVDKALVIETYRTDTPEAYERLLQVIDSDHEAYPTIQNRLAELRFDDLCSTSEGCRDFLKLYPNSPLVDKARLKAVEFDYAHAAAERTDKSLSAFISNYEHIDVAQSRVSDARSLLKTVHESELVSRQVTLAQLDSYASSHRRDASNLVFVVYDNLVNLPMHSYRYLSLKLGFNGVVGEVSEHVEQIGGEQFTSRFVFNAQGLLEQEYNGRYKRLTRYTYAFDSRHGFYPAKKTVDGKTYSYTCTWDAGNRLTKLACTDGSVVTFVHDQNGRVTSRTTRNAKGKVTEATYRSGKIRTENSSSAQLSYQKYDGACVTLIDSRENGKSSKWTYSYDSTTATPGWRQAKVDVDGVHRITITREYK